MAVRAQSWMLEPIPGYQGLNRGAALINFPSLPTDVGAAAPPPIRSRRVAPRRDPRAVTTASDLQNALYLAGMSFGLVVGTALGLSVLGIAGF